MKLKIRNSALKKRRLSGFLKRKSTKAGRRILARRRRKGRSLTTV
ncbi:MAG: 50S ribosomal protein L34 [Planctomycetota bacterium]